MGKLIDISNKIKQLTQQRLEAEVLAIIQNNDQVAINMNTDQLFSGKDALDKDLPDYSERSVTVFGKSPGPYTLFDTGDFYKGFVLRADKFPVVFDNTDRKTGKIADLLASKGHNPEDIYGLNKTNLTDFSRSYVLPEVRENVRKFLEV